ncbi:hypothetical protein NKH95_17580 [Mesorhizobium sp. M0848]|uniref:hypothetical protein n=1 Tax=Mesorhizobium sp. M0848 TaxID=2957012 RepID=UPI003338B4B4
MSKPPKRPIDLRRESAFSMTIGGQGDGAAVLNMVATTGSAFVIKQNSVHEIRLADQIDPDRTNINVPNTQQLFAEAGSESDIVARTFLSADALFTKTHFPDEKVRDRVVLVSAEIMTHLLAAQKVLDHLQADQEKRIADVKASNDPTRLPAVTEVESRANTFIQKAEHALQAIYRLAEVFYGPQMRAEGKFPDNLPLAFAKAFGENAPSTAYAKAVALFGHQVRNTRHCVEHRNENQRIVAKDFQLRPDGKVYPPSIEVVHPKTPLEETDLAAFMSDWLEGLTVVTETLLLYLADKNHAPFGNLSMWVGLVPEDQRHLTKVRVGYLMNFGGKLQRVG